MKRNQVKLDIRCIGNVLYRILLRMISAAEVLLTAVVNPDHVNALTIDVVRNECVLLSAQMLWCSEMIGDGCRALYGANERFEAKTMKVQ